MASARARAAERRSLSSSTRPLLCRLASEREGAVCFCSRFRIAAERLSRASSRAERSCPPTCGTVGGSPFGSRAAPAPRPECVRRAAAPPISSEQRVPEQPSEKLQHAACRAAKSARSTTCASASSTWSCTPVYGCQEAGAARSTAESAQRPVWLPSRSRSRCGDAGEDSRGKTRAEWEQTCDLVSHVACRSSSSNRGRPATSSLPL